MSEALECVEIHIPVFDDVARVAAIRRVEQTASIAKRGWFDQDRDAWVFYVPAPPLAGRVR